MSLLSTGRLVQLKLEKQCAVPKITSKQTITDDLDELAEDGTAVVVIIFFI